MLDVYDCWVVFGGSCLFISVASQPAGQLSQLHCPLSPLLPPLSFPRFFAGPRSRKLYPFQVELTWPWARSLWTHVDIEVNSSPSFFIFLLQFLLDSGESLFQRRHLEKLRTIESAYLILGCVQGRCGTMGQWRTYKSQQRICDVALSPSLNAPRNFKQIDLQKQPNF